MIGLSSVICSIRRTGHHSLCYDNLAVWGLLHMGVL